MQIVTSMSQKKKCLKLLLGIERQPYQVPEKAVGRYATKIYKLQICYSTNLSDLYLEMVHRGKVEVFNGTGPILSCPFLWILVALFSLK